MGDELFAVLDVHIHMTVDVVEEEDDVDIHSRPAQALEGHVRILLVRKDDLGSVKLEVQIEQWSSRASLQRRRLELHLIGQMH
jgi:hypothetical protein